MAKENYIRPIDIKHGIIDMTHGAGGRATAQLIDEVFAKAFRNTYLAQAHDGAVMPALKGEPVMSCDAHVVHPLFFAGGDIGRSPSAARSTTWPCAAPNPCICPQASSSRKVWPLKR